MKEKNYPVPFLFCIVYGFCNDNGNEAGGEKIIK
jgi:hypothetical protein